MPIPKLLVSALLMAGNMALTMTRHIEGPRLDDLKFSGGDPGQPWNIVFGRRRVAGLPIWARDLREVKQTRKTKGGKYNDYTYYEDAAYGAAGHEVAAIPKIYLDKKLVYDLTGVGPVSSFDFGGGVTSADVLAIYLGTATQEPDPYMQAFIEADLGEGYCPAYRNRAYVVLKGMPVGQFGNHFPQVEFEVFSDVAAHYPTERLDSSDGLTVASISADGATMGIMTFDSGGPFTTRFELWDIAARALISSGETPVLFNRIAGYGSTADGVRLFVANDDQTIYSTSDGIAWSLYATAGVHVDTIFTLQDGHGNEHWGGTGHEGAGWDQFVFDGTVITASDLTGGLDWRATHFFRDAWGDIWVCGINAGGSADVVQFYRIVSLGESEITLNHYAVTMPFTTGVFSVISAAHYSDDTHNQFVFYFASAIFIFDIATATLGASLASAASEEPIQRTFANLAADATSFWFNIGLGANLKEVSLADLTVIRSLNKSLWGFSGASLQQMLYEPVGHAIWSQFNTTGDDIDILYLDRVQAGSVTLGDVAANLAARVNVTEYDFSALDQGPINWNITQGSAAAALEPLLDAFDSDVAPHDFGMIGVKRSGVAIKTITTPWFVRDGPRYDAKSRPANQPLGIVYTFADVANDQNTNTARSARSSEVTGNAGEQTIDLSTFASDVDTMRNLADRHYRRLVNERDLTNALTAQQLALEPANCVTLDLDGESATYRLTRLTVRANDVLACEWKYDHPSLAVLDDGTGAANDGQEEQSIVVFSLCKGFVLDVPLARDADTDSAPVFYLGAGTYSDDVSFAGAVAYQAVGGEYTEEVGDVSSSSRATWGYATEVLGVVTSPWVWDRGHSLNVVVKSGALTGCTEADIDANPLRNLIALRSGDSWEWLNFTTVTPEGDGSFTLSGFKRGRRGTEWACGNHATGDILVLYASLEPDMLGLSDVGADLSVKVVSNGRSLAGASQTDITPFTGASLKPYAPANAHAVKQSNGDWVVYGIRRTRLGGGWTSGTTIPLSELTEEYEIDLSDGATDVTKTTGSLPYTWTSAAQTSDMGGAVAEGDLTGAVYQISDAVGRGFAAEFSA